MESQLSPTIWLPTLCHVNSALPQLHDPTTVVNKQIIRPMVATQQPVLLPSQSGHVIVQMQQVVPFLAGDASPLPLHPCHDYAPANLVVQSLPCVPQFSHAGTVVDQSVPQVLPAIQQVRRKLSVDLSNQPINKTQKKKKISPSAKRRSRMRLIAFLEAKKEKCANQTQDAALDHDSDVNSNSNSSPDPDHTKQVTKESFETFPLASNDEVSCLSLSPNSSLLLPDEHISNDLLPAYHSNGTKS